MADDAKTEVDIAELVTSSRPRSPAGAPVDAEVPLKDDCIVKQVCEPLGCGGHYAAPRTADVTTSATAVH